MRPLVYRLAVALQLSGWVRNDPQGVLLEVEGALPGLRQFLTRLCAEFPPLARLQSVMVRDIQRQSTSGFRIQQSARQGHATTQILPDVAPCAACLQEVAEVGNRRAGYAFTNCTHCGPRFSIVEALPYDRPHTTMRHFPLCPDCRAEYDNPLDRRFHAQPNACPVCGPSLSLCTPSGTCLARDQHAIPQAAALLRQGQIIAVKGLGGFHLLVEARNAAAIATLRARKARPDKPLAVMVSTVEQGQQLCDISPEAARCLTAPEAPIILLPRRPEAPVAPGIAPGMATLGLMLPPTPLHALLLQALGVPVVATSGNLGDEPICTDNDDALQRLGPLADALLMHNRPIARHVDDSVAWIVHDELRLLRRARGYAPLPVRLPHPVPTILALGAQQKNTVALSLGQQVFLSQHIGDLQTPQARAAFERVIDDFLRLYEATPVAIAHDVHPDYASTRWAQSYAARGALRRIPVQHHHAHLAACLAEHGVTAPALGITWDGTGYGPDGSIWGGEFLLGTAAAVTRVAHLRPFRLPGGEAAVREPRRLALALLWELYGEAGLAQQHLAPVQACSPTERRLLAHMLARGFNTPQATSAGRLFDAVAALIGLQQHVSFEGQAAMALEAIAEARVTEAYPMVITPAAQEHAPLVLDWQPIIQALLEDLQRGVAMGCMAARFHNAMVAAIVTIVQHIGVPLVVLTGGCFQNRWLTERVTRRLRTLGYEVLLHRQVPPNDGGLSLGQVAVAAAQLHQSSTTAGQPTEEAPCALAYPAR